MITTIGVFLGINALYHILVTTIAYGIFDSVAAQTIISILRDSIWIILVLFAGIKYYKKIIPYLKKYFLWWMLFSVLTLFSLGMSYYLGKNISSLLIGFKYTFYYLFIFLSATFLGYTIFKDSKHFSKYVKIGIILLFSIVVFWYLFQGAKMLFSDFFFHIGYGPLDDFVYAIKPPIYYLTGYKGVTRRQGIFSGPNNYGYFLIAFFPAIYYYLIKFPKNLIKRKWIWDIFWVVLWWITIVLTLSRSAYLWGLLALCLINFKAIRSNKKLFWGGLVVLILAVVGLSFLKYKSTLAHINLKLQWLENVVHRPLGYWLWTSGPSVHHDWNLLPENYFVQILLDVGTVGFLLWSAFIFWFFSLIKKIKKNFLVSSTKRLLIYYAWSALLSGFFLLLFIGLFLHVFEDSMVNYLLFIPLWLLTWFLSKDHEDDSFL